jgi:hypothetical protein
LIFLFCSLDLSWSFICLTILIFRNLPIGSAHRFHLMQLKLTITGFAHITSPLLYCWKPSQLNSLVSRLAHSLSSNFSSLHPKKQKPSQIFEPVEAQETDMTGRNAYNTSPSYLLQLEDQAHCNQVRLRVCIMMYQADLRSLGGRGS